MPITVMVLVLLASLTLAFTVMSSTEPQIASNFQQGVQALTLADAGLEEAIWGFSNPTVSGLSGYPTTTPARYNNTWIALGTGGYTISLTNGPGANERTVTATAWIPNTTAPRAKRVLTATLWSLKGRINPPAAITTQGQLQVSGTATVDARTSTCGSKVGSYTAQSTTLAGAAQIFGGDGNNIANEPTDYTQNTQPLPTSPPDPTFTALTFTQNELNALKAIAKANGTYYQGNVSFGSTLPNGVVFVDTVSGNPIGNPPNAADLASVTISGGTSSGWLVVMGSITMSGSLNYTGLIYAANDYVLNATGSPMITGAVVSLNVADTVATAIASLSGNATIKYDCNAINSGVATGGTGSPTVPQGFFVKPGTWKEVLG